jgi:hypothetical protein
MFPYDFPFEDEEEFVARVTQIAYQALLKQGLQRSFLDVQLELWQQIRTEYYAAISTHSDELVEVA